MKNKIVLVTNDYGGREALYLNGVNKYPEKLEDIPADVFTK